MSVAKHMAYSFLNIILSESLFFFLIFSFLFFFILELTQFLNPCQRSDGL